MPKANRFIAGTATALIAASLAACGAAGGSIATVNGTAISKAAFDQKLESGPAAASVLQQMVRTQLIDDYAKQNNIVISDADVQKREDEIKANFPNGSWDEMLKSRGMTEDDVHDLLRQQLILDKAVGGNVKVTDAQIAAYFAKNHASFDQPAQVKARHILVGDLATANKVEADLKSGKDFAAEAAKYSIDPGTKDKGGELGFFRRGQMVPAFDKAAFSQPIGVVGAPVKSTFGYHVIEVESRTPEVKATLANTHDRIADLLRQQQEGPLIAPFLQNLQAKANIQINSSNPALQAAFPPNSPAAAASPAQ